VLVVSQSAITEKILGTFCGIRIALVDKKSGKHNAKNVDCIFTDTRAVLIPKKKQFLRKIGDIDPSAWGLLASVTGGVALIGIPVGKFINKHLAPDQIYDVRLLNQLAEDSDGILINYDDITEFSIEKLQENKFLKIYGLSFTPTWTMTLRWETSKSEAIGNHNFREILVRDEAGEKQIRKIISDIESYEVVEISVDYS
jgi:hypothetical protein